MIEIRQGPKGLSEDTVRFISAKKNEPEWMLEWRLEAFRRWLTMREPTWARVDYPKIDYQDFYYYSAPKKKRARSSLDEVDPEILTTYEKLGIPLREQEMLAGVVRGPEGDARRVAVDAVFDSVSVATTFKEELKKAGVIFMPISEALREHPELVQKYLGIGRAGDRQFLRDAEFGGVLRRLVRLRAAGRALPDGAVDLFPHQREEHRPVRAHADHRRQGLLRQPISKAAPRRCATRTSCMPPWSNWSRSTMPRSNIRPCRTGIRATREGKGGIYNFVTKRGDCRGKNSKISWTQVETGSAITWKYPSCILRGDDSRGEFYSIAISNGHAAGRQRHQDDPSRQEHDEPDHLQGHRGGRSQNTYRGLVSAHRKATERAQLHRTATRC